MLASFPGLPRFSSLVCVQYNVLYWMQTEKLKWGRPGNEAKQTLSLSKSMVLWPLKMGVSWLLFGRQWFQLRTQMKQLWSETINLVCQSFISYTYRSKQWFILGNDFKLLPSIILHHSCNRLGSVVLRGVRAPKVWKSSPIIERWGGWGIGELCVCVWCVCVCV